MDGDFNDVGLSAEDLQRLQPVGAHHVAGVLDPHVLQDVQRIAAEFPGGRTVALELLPDHRLNDAAGLGVVLGLRLLGGKFVGIGVAVAVVADLVDAGFHNAGQHMGEHLCRHAGNKEGRRSIILLQHLQDPGQSAVQTVVSKGQGHGAIHIFRVAAAPDHLTVHVKGQKHRHLLHGSGSPLIIHVDSSDPLCREHGFAPPPSL